MYKKKKWYIFFERVLKQTPPNMGLMHAKLSSWLPFSLWNRVWRLRDGWQWHCWLSLFLKWVSQAVVQILVQAVVTQNPNNSHTTSITPHLKNHKQAVGRSDLIPWWISFVTKLVLSCVWHVIWEPTIVATL